MIPYEDLVRALDRHRRSQAGEYVADEASAFPAGMEAGDMATEPQEILDGADFEVEAVPEYIEVGDMTDESAVPPGHGEYIEGADGEVPQDHLPAELPPDDPNAQQGEGTGTIYGMPAAPPPPPADAEPPPPDGEDPNRQ